MSFRQNLLLSLGIILSVCAYSQTEVPQITDTTVILSPSQSSKYLDIVTNKAHNLEQKLDKQSSKALRQMQKMEKRIGGKLARLDSNKAKEIFGNAEQQYKELAQRLEKGSPLQQYLPQLDSLSSSLKFLEKNEQLLAQTTEARQKLKTAMNKIAGMEGRFQNAEVIKNFLKERKMFLREKLNGLGFAKELKKIGKKNFYYQAQIAEYKEALKDHRKAERKALQLLSKSKLFQKFFQKNSRLASLFRLPGDPEDPSSFGRALAGLQTRGSVNILIQSQIAAGGPNAQQQFQQNVQNAQSQLNQLKDKLLKASPFDGSGSSGDELPDFIVNNQRKKSFWKKWETGINTQSNKPNNFFPVTTDLSMMAGFRPHDGYVVGVGIGGLIGWGRDIRHIDISSQGMKIKSFAEIKIKGSFHFAAGYELNYHSEIKRIEQLKNYNSWTRSGLAGISKIISLRSPKGGAGGGFFKKAKAQLLWDFLSYSQVPKINQPIVFRIGYNIR